MRSLILPAILLLPLSLTAQKNWVTNGDFEKGKTGWSISGPGGTPKVMAYMTDGLKNSNAFSVQAGGNTFRPPHAPLVLKQTIVTVPNSIYEISADIAISGSVGNAQAGIFEIKIGGVSVAKKDFGRYTGGSNPHDRLCERFKLAKGGNQILEVLISRPRYIWSSRTPRHYIDNIRLILTTDPIFCIRGDRALGKANTYNVQGRPNAAFAVFLAPKLLPTPVPVPGFSGRYALDVATTVPFYGGVLDVSGRHSMSFTMPNLSVLDKAPLYFQALQADKTAGLSFGPFHNWGFHK